MGIVPGGTITNAPPDAKPKRCVQFFLLSAMKMLRHKPLIIIVSFATIYSCAPIKNSYKQEITPLNNNNYRVLNGTYKNYLSDSSSRQTISLWSALNPNKRFLRFDTARLFTNERVLIELKRKNRLTAKLFNDTRIVAEKRYKGKLKDGYFVARRKVKYFGIPFIYVSYSDYQFRLGKSTSGRLLLDVVNGSFGEILILTAGHNDYFNFQFKSQ